VCVQSEQFLGVVQKKQINNLRNCFNYKFWEINKFLRVAYMLRERERERMKIAPYLHCLFLKLQSNILEEIVLSGSY
jgi:hypothetical protein